jgi:hypothetical protein
MKKHCHLARTQRAVAPFFLVSYKVGEADKDALTATD